MNNSFEERFESYCKNFNYDIIPQEHHDKWCILFGSIVFETAFSFEEALKKQDDLTKHNIATFIISPKNYLS